MMPATHTPPTWVPISVVPVGRHSSLASPWLLGALALAAGAACARAPHPPAPPPSPPPCEHGYTATVTNNAEYGVDVFTYTPTGRELLGTVSAKSRARLTGGGGADSVVWRPVPENPPRFRPLGEVILHLECT